MLSKNFVIHTSLFSGYGKLDQALKTKGFYYFSSKLCNISSIYGRAIGALCYCYVKVLIMVSDIKVKAINLRIFV